MIPNIGLFDVLIGGFFLLIIYFFVLRWINKNESSEQTKYFLLAISLKIIGGLVFSWLSIYYYKKGDTFLYYEIAENLRTNFFENFSETLSTLFTSYENLEFQSYNPLKDYNYNYERITTWNFSRIIFLLNLLSFGSYIGTTILISVISFIGLWLGYTGLSNLYPSLSKYFLIPFFLIPSALIWSSGILKDTIIVAGVGFFIYAMLGIIHVRRKTLNSILFWIISMVVLYYLRPIFMFVFLSWSLIWIIPLFTRKINFFGNKKILNVMTFIFLIGIGVIVNYYVFPVDSKYRVTNLLNTLKGFQTFHSMEVFSFGQNGYTLGGVIEQPIDVLLKIPAAINVTFLRPYFWEVNNLPTLFGAIEANALFVMILVFISKQYKNTGVIFKDNNVLFFFLVAITFAAIVGMSSYNFGALSRYKIISVMFLIIAMLMIINKNNHLKVDNFKPNT